MLGSAILRVLSQSNNDFELIGWTSQELDLRDAEATTDALVAARPDAVIMAAGKVGGIAANRESPVEFLNENIAIQSSLFQASHRANVSRLLFLGSSCVYPVEQLSPIPEEALLTGGLESTSEAYAVAKIAGLVAVRSYRAQYGHRWISAIPASLYGPNDNFDSASSHVLAGLVGKFHDARESKTPSVVLWGSGLPRREFLYVDDMARACMWLLSHYDDDLHVNVGCGTDVSVLELAGAVADIVGYSGEVIWDGAMPDGVTRKLLDSRRIRESGWIPKVGLNEGIRRTYAWYRDSRMG